MPILQVKNEAQGGDETTHPASPGTAWVSALAAGATGFTAMPHAWVVPAPSQAPRLPTPWAPGEGPSRRLCGSRGPPWCQRQGWESWHLLSGRWRMPVLSLRCQLDGDRERATSVKSLPGELSLGGNGGAESSDSSQLVITTLLGQIKLLRLRAQGAGRAGQDPEALFSGSGTTWWGPS